jgi:hypothetical protein
MSTLVVIGVIAIVLVAVAISIWAIGALIMELAWSGEVAFSIVPIIIAVAAWYFVWSIWPFQLVLKGGAA